jgi:general secretion pathway protein D
LRTYTDAAFRTTVAILVLATAACARANGAAPAPGRREDASPTPPGTHTLNLKDADIQVLIATGVGDHRQELHHRPNVQGKVTVVSATPMKPDEI